MQMKRRIQLVAAGLSIGAVSVIGAGSALAQDDDTYLAPTSTVAPEVLGVQDEQGEVSGAGAANSAEVAGATQVQGSALAFTGGDAAALALVGGVAVAGGAGLVLARRRVGDA